MDILALIGVILTGIGIIVGAAVAIMLYRKQAELEHRLAIRQDERQRRREMLQACEALRDLLDKWYRTLEENVSPDQSPGQILANITKLNTHRQFQHEYSTLIGKIRDANEPLCEPLLHAARVFHQSALSTKGRINMAITQNPYLNRLYSLSIAPSRNERAGQEQASEEAKAYVKRLLRELQIVYFGADDELERAMAQLRDQINRTS
jgi:signal transduction histidine kinase